MSKFLCRLIQSKAITTLWGLSLLHGTISKGAICIVLLFKLLLLIELHGITFLSFCIQQG